MMSRTASDYDVTKLVIGIGLAALALLSGSAAASPTIATSWRGCYPLLAISLSYGMMMFASSLR